MSLFPSITDMPVKKFINTKMNQRILFLKYEPTKNVAKSGGVIKNWSNINFLKMIFFVVPGKVLNDKC